MATENKGPADFARISSHEEMLRENGYDLVSPITGSMRPMIRPNRDVTHFAPPSGRLRKYDVALYRRGELAIMHRVIGVGDGHYIIRGDNSHVSEKVQDEQVIGVMQGFYRDERYIRADGLLHQTYARLWVAAHPLLMIYKRLRWGMHRLKRHLIRY